MVRGATLLQAQRWAGTLTATFAFIACAVSGELGPVTMTLFPVGLVGSVLLARRVEGRLGELDVPVGVDEGARLLGE